VSNDGLTLEGETIGPIVDGERKAELLEVIAQAESIGSEQVSIELLTVELKHKGGCDRRWCKRFVHVGCRWSRYRFQRQTQSTREGQTTVTIVRIFIVIGPNTH
jgi:hypothetical protein